MKSDLEAEARRRKISVRALLEDIVVKWQRNHHAQPEDDEAEVARIRAAIRKSVGTVPLRLGPYTNERVRTIIGDKLARKYGRKRSR